MREALRRNFSKGVALGRKQTIKAPKRLCRQNKIDVLVPARFAEPGRFLRPSAEQQTRRAALTQPAHDLRYGIRVVSLAHRAVSQPA